MVALGKRLLTSAMSCAVTQHDYVRLTRVARSESPSKIRAAVSPFEQNVLSAQCGSLRDMHALTHGSEPNYLGITSGGYPNWALCDLIEVARLRSS